jgi:hypothetical protein
MEGKLQEKKVLSTEEIEAQTLLELPDRQLMQNTITTGPVNLGSLIQFISQLIEVSL